MEEITCIADQSVGHHICIYIHCPNWMNLYKISPRTGKIHNKVQNLTVKPKSILVE